MAEETRALVALIEDAYAPVLDRIQADGHAAALVNGSVLAVHGEPNFEASSLEDFAPDAATEERMVWGRSIAAKPNDPALAARVLERKRRLRSMSPETHSTLLDIALPTLTGTLPPSRGERQDRRCLSLRFRQSEAP